MLKEINNSVKGFAIYLEDVKGNSGTSSTGDEHLRINFH